MKIEEYCAQQAYALYLKNNPKQIIQKRNDFIPQFIRDLRKNVTTFLNQFPQDRDTVRKSLTQILKSNFEHLQENNILDSSGNIKPEAIFTHLGEGVKKSLPEIYQKVQEAQQLKKQNLVQNEENLQEEKVDFGNKEESQKFLDGLYTDLANCQTKAEKAKYLQSKFGISLENMTETQQDKIISKYETRGKVKEIKKTLNRAEIQGENPYLTDEEFEEFLENTAVEQYAIENNKDVEIEKNNNKKMIQLDEIFCEIQKLNQELSSCNDKIRKIEINNELEELKNRQKAIIHTLALTETEIQKNNEASIEYEKNTRIAESKKYTNDIKNDSDLSDFFSTEENELDNELLSSLFDTSVDETEEDLSNLFTAEESLKTETVLDNRQEKTAFTNPILTNVKQDDLKEEDYRIEVEENQGFWNKLKNVFSKIKHTVSEKFGFNKVKLLNKQKYLNTAENNTKTTHNYSEAKSNFDQSLLVSKEEQEKYKKEYEQQKSVSQRSSSQIHSDNNQSIKL